MADALQSPGQSTFAWVQALTQQQHQRLRRCRSPRSARAGLVRSIAEQEELSSSGLHPPRIVDDPLRWRMHLVWQDIQDLEEKLQELDAEHEAQVAAMTHEHVQSCKHAGLRAFAALTRRQAHTAHRQARALNVRNPVRVH